MDSNQTDLIIQDEQQQTIDVHIMELYKIYMLNFFMKSYGPAKLFVILQRNHDLRMLDEKLSFLMLLSLFAFTWLLGSPLYSWVARLIKWLARLVTGHTNSNNNNQNSNINDNNEGGNAIVAAGGN